MANNTVNYLIKISTAGQASVDKATTSVDKLDKSVNTTSASFKKLATGAAAFASALGVVSFIKASTEAYKQKNVVVTKLGQVMHNTMNATQEQTESIIRLTQAQQKLGVVEDYVQIAGAQELGTYLTMTSTLEKLIPVMNDVVAQQYGLNASQESAVGIATMMGKVMDGQVGALSRFGYTFSEAEEKILKFGTEEQRAATLADVVYRSVEGMNAALAQTPEGKMLRLNRALGAVQEKVGELWLKFASTVIVGTLDGISAAIDKVVGLYNSFVQAIKDGNPWLVALGTILVGVATYMLVMRAGIIANTIAMGSMKVVTVAVTVATKLWAAAQWLLNSAMYANPIGLIIAGVVALIALIAYVAYKTEGWGKTWENVLKFMSTLWDTFKAQLHLKWLQVQDFFMKGIELIQKGWYKLQGLWNKDAANAGLAKLEQQRNERAKEIAAAKGKVDDLNQQLSEMKVWEVSWSKEKKMSDMVNSVQESLGIRPSSAQGAGMGDVPGDIRKGSEAVATGGTRSTNINIDIGKLLETVNIYAQDFSDGMKDLEDKVIEAVTRALVTAQSLAR